MRSQIGHHVAAIAIALFLIPSGVFGHDMQVSSELWAQGYSVPASDGSLISRRRLVEDLHLAAWNLLPGSDDPYYQGLRLSVEMSLRLDTDFSIAKNESDSSVADAYIPGLTPMQMDMMFVYLDARGFWEGVLDVRAGRQIRVDTIGFFAFDGIETVLHLPGYLAVSTYLGYEVKGGHRLGYDQLELDGVDSGGRDGMDPGTYPDREDPDSEMAFGTEVSWFPRSWLDVGAAVRVVGLSKEISSQLFGGRLDAGTDPLRFHGRIMWSPMLDRRDDLSAAVAEGTLLREADAEITVTPVDALALSAEYHLFRPMFAADSIFNVFDLAPRRDLGGRLEVFPGGKVSVATWAYARMADQSAGLSGEEIDATVSGVGGGFGGNYRTLSNRFSSRVSALREWGESRVGAEIGGGHGFVSGRLWLGLRLSYWHIDDDYSERFNGDLFGYMASARFRLLKGAHLAGELENYFSEGEDPRVVVLALLQLDLWR